MKPIIQNYIMFSYNKNVNPVMYSHIPFFPAWNTKLLNKMFSRKM